MLTYIQWRRNEFKSGTHVLCEAPETFLSCPSTFLALWVQLVVLMSAFVMVSAVSCLLFTSPPCPAICKSGGTCPLAVCVKLHLRDGRTDVRSSVS